MSAISETRSRENTRKRILSAASDCFVRSGVQDATMEDVAQEAGVTRMTLYRHMASRDELVLAVVLADWEVLSVGLRAVLDEQADASARLLEGISFVSGEIIARPYLLELMRSGRFETWLGAADDRLLLDTFGRVITPYLELHRAELRSTVDDTLEWLFRQVFLLLTVPPLQGLTTEEIRRQTGTFVIPSVLRNP
jgi:AcrR family transcriptional regulator